MAIIAVTGEHEAKRKQREAKEAARSDESDQSDQSDRAAWEKKKKKEKKEKQRGGAKSPQCQTGEERTHSREFTAARQGSAKETENR